MKCIYNKLGKKLEMEQILQLRKWEEMCSFIQLSSGTHKLIPFLAARVEHPNAVKWWVVVVVVPPTPHPHLTETPSPTLATTALPMNLDWEPPTTLPKNLECSCFVFARGGFVAPNQTKYGHVTNFVSDAKKKWNHSLILITNALRVRGFAEKVGRKWSTEKRLLCGVDFWLTLTFTNTKVCYFSALMWLDTSQNNKNKSCFLLALFPSSTPEKDRWELDKQNWQGCAHLNCQIFQKLVTFQ